MAKGRFINLTGVKNIQDIDNAISCLQLLMPEILFKFTNKRINTISAYSKLPQKVFFKLLNHRDVDSLFLIKQYHHMTCKINVKLKKPPINSPNICVNLFKSGGACFFGCREEKDLETFLSTLFNFANE